MRINLSKISGDPVRLNVIKTIENRRLLEAQKSAYRVFRRSGFAVLFIFFFHTKTYGFKLYAVCNHMIEARRAIPTRIRKTKCAFAVFDRFTVKNRCAGFGESEGKSRELAARDARYKAFSDRFTKRN